MAKRFEYLEHTADFQLIAYGLSFEELCVNAARGMTEWMFNPQLLPERGERVVSLRATGQDKEDLLVEWLSQILFQSLTTYAAPIVYENVFLSEGCLEAQISFAPASATKDIKAVTYHDLQVIETEGRWSSRVTFDI